MVFIVIFKVLHAIFGALPGFAWWWKASLAQIKTLEVEGLRHTLGASWSRLAKRRHNSHHNGAPDVEKGFQS